jgi:hypothetical protein
MRLETRGVWLDCTGATAARLLASHTRTWILGLCAGFGAWRLPEPSRADVFGQCLATTRLILGAPDSDDINGRWRSQCSATTPQEILLRCGCLGRPASR